MATLRLTIVETSTLADTPQLLELVEWEEEEVMDLVVEEDTPDKVEQEEEGMVTIEMTGMDHTDQEAEVIITTSTTFPNFFE